MKGRSLFINIYNAIKNMTKLNKILVGGFAVVVAGAFATSSVMAYQGDYSKQGPEYSPERHATMIETMNNNDYQAWSELMTNRGRITKVINEENFAQFAKAHELAKSGDIAGADEIRKELGLRTSNGERMGKGHGEKHGMHKGEGQRHGRMNGENR